MSGRFLLDSNIVIALFARDATILEHLAQAEAILIPTIVIGELYYGARKSARASDNIARLEAFAAVVPVLGCDAHTASHYGRIKDDPRRKGQPIPENDIWIAAIALRHGLTLVTRDAHLGKIDALPVVAW